MTGTGRIACSLTASVACALALGACGGARQDAGEHSTTYAVSVVRASFPRAQTLAQPTQMLISVRNDSDKTIPDLAVTVDSFFYASNQPNLADSQRPAWVIDRGPLGGTTAYTNTWTGGKLAPHRVRTLVWRVTAVNPGVHRVKYTVAAGLNGKAKARLAGGGLPVGNFTVLVRRRPPQSCVDDSGRVITLPESHNSTAGNCARASAKK